MSSAPGSRRTATAAARPSERGVGLPHGRPSQAGATEVLVPGWNAARWRVDQRCAARNPRKVGARVECPSTQPGDPVNGYPEPSFGHLLHLSDEVGLLERAFGTEPSQHHGY